MSDPYGPDVPSPSGGEQGIEPGAQGPGEVRSRFAPRTNPNVPNPTSGQIGPGQHAAGTPQLAAPVASGEGQQAQNSGAAKASLPNSSAQDRGPGGSTSTSETAPLSASGPFPRYPRLGRSSQQGQASPQQDQLPMGGQASEHGQRSEQPQTPPPAQFPQVRIGYPQPVAAAPTTPATQKHGTRKAGPGWTALIAAMLLTSAASVGTTIALTGDSSDQVAEPAAAEVTQQSGTTPTVEQQAGGPDWETVAEAVRPATVSIQTDGEGEMGTGSGVIIDSEGRIVTNQHVVSNVLNSGSITVSLNDGRLYEAEVIGSDSTTDIAVIQLINAPADLMAANLSTSGDLKVGQPVMAVGSPLGLSDTVTTGVISALDRPVVVSADTDPSAEAVVTNAIQIDASINPGNSGGPLFDASGSVVGINSSIASLATSSDSAGSIGLGFAIPIDLVNNITSQIIDNGTVQHSVLGVQIMSGSSESEGGTVLGAAVAEVITGSAAHEAGLQTGDVIVGIGGHQVVSGPSLTGYVRRYQVGETVVLDVLRDGQLMQVDVTLKEKV